MFLFPHTKLTNQFIQNNNIYQEIKFHDSLKELIIRKMTLIRFKTKQKSCFTINM